MKSGFNDRDGAKIHIEVNPFLNSSHNFIYWVK